MEDAFSGALSGFKSKWEKAKEAITSKTATIKGQLQDSFSSAIDAFKKRWEKAKKAITSKTATIKIGFTDNLKNGWNTLAKKVNSARSKSSLAKKLLPSMPYLAQGGYVKANTPQLAVIGDNKREGEIVAPESKLTAMAEEVAGAGNQQIISLLTNILNALIAKDMSVYLDGEQIKNNTVRRINQHTVSTGKLELII